MVVGVEENIRDLTLLWEQAAAELEVTCRIMRYMRPGRPACSLVKAIYLSMTHSFFGSNFYHVVISSSHTFRRYHLIWPWSQAFIISGVNHLFLRRHIDSVSPARNGGGSLTPLNNTPTGYQPKQATLTFEEEPVIMPCNTSPTSTTWTADISNITKLRKRFNLFIDLIWTGIVSNISEILLGRCRMMYESFLMIYSIRIFLQNWFIVWILVLGLLFGNNMSYFSGRGRSNIVVWIYLASKGSFISIRIFYCIFLPEL
ncbi:hypothetical protein BDZ45DRAFT_748479 [Acephala macrosclerotiorum]|nr:hypothetical protein BDZ45DRAFT_748479 [Acephala macrosclerotiorum]